MGDEVQERWGLVEGGRGKTNLLQQTTQFEATPTTSTIPDL